MKVSVEDEWAGESAGTGSIATTLIAPPNLVESIDTLPGSNRGVNRRRSKAWDRLECGVYWFDDPD